MINLIYHIWNT